MSATSASGGHTKSVSQSASARAAAALAPAGAVAGKSVVGSAIARVQQKPVDSAANKSSASNVASSSRKRSAPGGPGNEQDNDKRQLVVQGFERKSGLKRTTAEALERSCLDVACVGGRALTDKEALKEYNRQYKRLCTHLRQNSTLVSRFENGELNSEHAAKLHDSELIAETYRSELQQFRQENLHEALAVLPEETAHWTPSDLYSCPLCDSVKCVWIMFFRGTNYYDDNNQEPSFTIRCTACQHVWKESEVDGGRAAAGSEDAASVAADCVTSSVAKPDEAPSIWDRKGTDPASTGSWMIPASKEESFTQRTI